MAVCGGGLGITCGSVGEARRPTPQFQEPVQSAAAAAGTSRRAAVTGLPGLLLRCPQPSLSLPGSRVSAAPRLQAGGRAGRRAGSCAA